MKLKQIRKIFKSIQAMPKEQQSKAIQAFETEGYTFDVAMSSMLDGSPISGVSGTSNIYTTYSAQTTAISKKYNGTSEWGNSLVRACIDMRTAFICGEAFSIAGKKLTTKHREFFEELLTFNGFNTTRLFNLNKKLEMDGKALLDVIQGNESNKHIPIIGIYNEKGLKVKPTNGMFPDLGQAYYKQQGNGEAHPIKMNKPTLLVTGGDGYDLNNTTTKVGLVLSECDNYDRCLKEIREINYDTARVTPAFKVNSLSEVSQLTKWLKENKWKRGEPFIGTADLEFKSPQTGALDNLKSELTSNLKTISGVTGCLVHWLGYVDLMSNRATAEELYQTIYNATIMERTAIQKAFKKILIDAQEVYIDSGFGTFKTVVKDFEVTLPLIDLGRFKDIVDSYSKLYMDEIISKETYRNNVPNIDPLVEQTLEEQQEKEDIKKLAFELPEEKAENNKDQGEE